MNAREKIKEIARSMITASHYNNLDDDTFDGYIREILNLTYDNGEKVLAILDEDQSLPEESLPPTEEDERRAHCGQWGDTQWYYAGYARAEENLVNQGWKKVKND